MSTELAVQERPALVPARQYDAGEMQLLTDTIARGCDENEFKLFIKIAQMSRLNPFTGQIRPVKRWNSDLGRNAMVVQTGIDGYRAIASRTTELAGIDDATFDAEGEDHPNWAKVTVYRWSHNEKIAYTATARWKEYVQTKKGGDVNAMWSRMPYLMLAKCAEALALRKAFPDDLAGIYTDEEMGQADNPPEATSKPAITMPKRTTEKQAEEPPQTNDHTPERLEGVIQEVREGQAGALWLKMKDGKIVYLADKFVDDGIKPGETLIALATKVNNTKVPYYGVIEVYDTPPAEEVPAEDVTPSLDELFEEGKVQKASDLPPGNGVKKLGTGRAKSLHMLRRTHEKKTGLTDEILYKLAALPPYSVEHLSDLPEDAFKVFQDLCEGKQEWKPLLEEAAE